MISFSIIVPMYNSEEFLPDFLTQMSLQLESHEKMELLLVNDGSVDSTHALASSFKNKYPNQVIYIKQENSGVSRARNIALERARGDWVGFADPDDSVPENAYQILGKTLAKGAYEIVGGNYIKYGTRAGNEINKIYEYCGVSGLSYLAESLEKNIDLPRPIWNNFYMRAFIEKIGLKFDPTVRPGQDLLFNLLAFSKASSVCQVDEVVYRYRKDNPQSITNQAETKAEQWVNSRIIMSKRILDYVHNGYFKDKAKLFEEYGYEFLIRTARQLKNVAPAKRKQLGREMLNTARRYGRFNCLKPQSTRHLREKIYLLLNS